MNEQLNRIQEKLALLKRYDSSYQVFGAMKHRYQLNPVKTSEELTAFEETHKIKLPEGYRAFLTTIGNGGAGPYYGMEKLESGIFIDLDYPSDNDRIDLSTEFAFTEPWNLDFRSMSEAEYKAAQDDYYHPKWASGLLRIANYGCGISINMVVNGKEYGKIWMDDRCNDGGIYPEHYFGNTARLGFLDWYELWLDVESKGFGGGRQR